MPFLVKYSVIAKTRNRAGNLIRGIGVKVEKEARKILRDTLDKALVVLRKYPRRRAKQKYVRTYNLQNNWKRVSVPQGYQIVNNASVKGRKYAKYVVGDAVGNWQNQKYHAGRWYLFANVMKEYIGKAARKIKSSVKLISRMPKR